MPISIEQIRNDSSVLLTDTEGQWFDRKGAMYAARDIGKVLVAFANAEGGLLAVGASRDKGLGGFARNPKQLNSIRQAAIDHTSPPVLHTVHTVDCINLKGEADELVILEVPASESFHEMTNGSSYLRVGDETRELDRDQILQLRYDKGAAVFDGEIATGFVLADLDTEALGNYRRQLVISSERSNQHVLAARGLFREHGSQTGVTWGGALLFGDDPLRVHPNNSVRILKYQGLTALTGRNQNISDEYRAEGTIPKIIEGVRAQLPLFFNNLRQLDMTTGRFVEVSEYPESVWLKAVVNAVTHRSYANFGDHIRIRIFDNRMEVESPGRLPGLVRPDNIRSTRFARNPRIARVLADLGYVQELGEGVDRMFEDMISVGLPEPDFRQGDASVTVTLFNNRGLRQRKLLVQDRTSPMSIIVSHLEQMKRVTTGEVIALLRVSRPTANRVLSELASMQIIERVGVARTDPTAYWRLKEPPH